MLGVHIKKANICDDLHHNSSSSYLVCRYIQLNVTNIEQGYILSFSEYLSSVINECPGLSAFQGISNCSLHKLIIKHAEIKQEYVDVISCIPLQLN